MNAKLRWSGMILLLLLAGFCSLWGLKRAGAPWMSESSWETLDDGRFSFDMVGERPVVVCFFSTTCLPCKEALAALEALDTGGGLGAKPLAIAVCVDPYNHDAARGWVRELDLTMPVILDFDAGLAKRFGVQMVPETYVLDGDGGEALHFSGWERVSDMRLRGALGSTSGTGLVLEAKR